MVNTEYKTTWNYKHVWCLPEPHHFRCNPVEINRLSYKSRTKTHFSDKALFLNLSLKKLYFPIAPLRMLTTRSKDEARHVLRKLIGQEVVPRSCSGGKMYAETCIICTNPHSSSLFENMFRSVQHSEKNFWKSSHIVYYMSGPSL